LQRRDPEAAAEAMREHIDQIADLVQHPSTSSPHG
jgi:DNA-binding GntR family transcriptional regulator